MKKGDVVIIRKYTNDAWKKEVRPLIYRTSVVSLSQQNYVEFANTERDWGFIEEDIIMIQKGAK